jgi:hypothetical protein
MRSLSSDQTFTLDIGCWAHVRSHSLIIDRSAKLTPSRSFLTLLLRITASGNAANQRRNSSRSGK